MTRPTATPVAEAAPSAEDPPGVGCFHCGQPVEAETVATATVLGHSRAFCCHGCLAVARSIVAAGLEAYYAHRSERAATVDPLPDFVRRLGFYDHPEVQRSFVRDRAGTREASLLLENIRCAACLWLNERALRALDGVLDVEIDYTSHHARVHWDPARIRLSEILEHILSIGYVAHPYDASRREGLDALQRRRSTERLIFAGAIGMMVMNFALAGYVMGLGDETGELSLWTRIGRWTSLFGVTTLLAYPGQEFFVGAWHDLRNRRLGMDVPIVLGLVTAYLGSLYATWSGRGEVYYDSIAMFVFLVLLARRFELRGRRRATDALDRVARILPRVTTRLDADGEHEVLVSELRPGDRVRVRPGETVPSDGRVTEGASQFDESALTGESVPVARTVGDPVIGGTCNVDQPVLIEVLATSGESTAADIQRLLLRGLHEAPHYAALAQRAASWFVALVLLIAAATAATWWVLDPTAALPNTIAVLIVTCPCALALATPVAAAIAVARLADHGVLTLSGEALERLARCDHMAFDKTGTLTTGALRVLAVEPFGRLDRDAAIALAAALEAHSTHPIAKALRAACTHPVAPAEDQRHHPTAGVSGRIAGVGWRIGHPAFVFPPGTAPAGYHGQAQSGVEGRRVVLGNQVGDGAVFVLEEQRRRGIDDLVPSLRAQGIRGLTLLSGDQRRNVQELAADLGFDEIHADCTPAAKLDWIADRQAAGARVAMVGDGINDAPTLAAADVSVSFADATDLAQAHSDLLILGGDLAAIPATHRIALRTRRIIRANLLWAVFYNLLAVPAAALGWIAPWGAAIGMSASSLVVVLNALRLRR